LSSTPKKNDALVANAVERYSEAAKQKEEEVQLTQEDLEMLANATGPDTGEVLTQATVAYSDAFPLKAEEVSTDRFIKIRKIGRGAIGVVYLVRMIEQYELESGEPDKNRKPKYYALKVVTKEEMIKKNKVSRVMTEREVLATTSHPYVVKLYSSFQTKTKLYYVMEWMEAGELYRVLQKQPGKRISEDAAKFYAAEIILALEYLHLRGFVYRDLKPENVLMRKDGHLAIADFDLSKAAAAQASKVVEKKMGIAEKLKIIAKGQRGNMSNLDIVNGGPIISGDCKSFVGTEEYLAPEVISGEQQSASVDWWALGVLVFEMLYGCTPFRGEGQNETFSNILSGDVKFPADIVISKEGKDLLKRLLMRDAGKRLGSTNGAMEIKNHKWFAPINWGLIRDTEPPIVMNVDMPTEWWTFSKKMTQMDGEDGEAGQNGGDNVFANFDTSVKI